jgi:hypothetical protein
MEMPENEDPEYDMRSASRFVPISTRIDNGLSANDAFPAIQDAFYDLLQSVWRKWKKCKVDVVQLFQAALDEPTSLNFLIKQVRNDVYALQLRTVAKDLESSDMEGLIAAFLDSVWVSAQAQLRLDCREGFQSAEFMDQVQGMLGRIRRCLSKNVSRLPPRIKREPRPDIGTRLSESLL